MKNIPIFPDFAMFGLEHKVSFETALKAFQPRISEYTFSEIFAWRGTRGTMISTINDNIILKFHKENDVFLSEPIGNTRIPESIKQALEWMKNNNVNATVFGATPEIIETFGEKKEWFNIEDDRADYDYVYEAKELAELAGRKYDGKRNHLKQFNKNYAYEFVDMNEQNVAECIKFQDKWCFLKPCEEGTLLHEENLAVMEMLTNFGKLSAIGGVLKIDGQVEGFTIAGELNSNTVVVYVEKANHDFKGIYQALNNLFVKKSLIKYTYINREQDVGDEGLRKAKLSYRPVFLVEKKLIRLK